MARNTKTWDTFFGPDPLKGRTTDFSCNRKQESVSRQNFITTFTEARTLAAKLNKNTDEGMVAPAKLMRKRSLDLINTSSQPKTTFAAVVASNSVGKIQQHCSFCKQNRESFAVYSTHTTNNCLVLQEYVCGICGLKGHTISHCRMNLTGASIVSNMRRMDEISRQYYDEFPKP